MESPQILLNKSISQVPIRNISYDPYLRDTEGKAIGDRQPPTLREETKLIIPDVPKIKEVYDPRLGMYISTLPKDQFGTSVVTRSPTIEEREKFRELEIRGGIFDRPVSEIIKQSKIERVNIKKFQELTKDIDKVGENLRKEIENLEKKNVRNDVWVGKEKDYGKYQESINRYNQEINKRLKDIEFVGGTIGEDNIYYEQKKVRVGLPFIKEKNLFEVPITSITATTPSGIYGQTISEGVGVIGDWIGKTTGDIGFTYAGIPYDITKKEEFISPRYYGEKVGDILRDPSLLKDYLRKSTKPDVVYDLVSGEARVPTQEDLRKKGIVSPQFIITKEQAQEGGRVIGKTIGDIGKYFIPYARLGFLASDVEREVRPFDYNPIEFTKEELTQAILLGGTIFGLGGIKTIRKFKQPEFLLMGDELIVTTKGQRLLGGKIKTSLYKDDSLLKSGVKFEYIPTEGRLKLKKQPIGKGQLPESIKEITPKVLSLSDERTMKVLEDFITPIKDTKGFTRFIIDGKKTIVTKPTKSKVSASLYKDDSLLKSGVQLEYIPKGEEIIFRGLSPYTKEGKLERARVLKEFKELGVESKIVKPLIALKYPKVQEIKSDITGLTIEGEKGVRLYLREKEIISEPKIKFVDIFGTTISRGKKPIERIRDIEFYPKGITKEGEQIFGGQFLEYTKSKPLGKRIETFEGLTLAKKIGEKEIQLLPTKIEGVGIVSKPTMFEFYKSKGITRKVIPKERISKVGEGDIILKKPTEREVIDLNDLLGLNKDVGYIRTNGKKSSSGYLQKLYSQKQEVLAMGLKKVKDIKKIPKSKPSKTFQENIETFTPSSIWAGKGLYERTTSVGVLKFDRQDISLSPRVISIQPEQVRVQMDVAQRNIQDTKIDLLSKERNLFRLTTESKLQEKDLSRLKEKQIIREKLRVKQGIRQIEKERLKPKQVILIQKPLEPKPGIPKIPKVPKLKLLLPFEEEEERIKIGEELFEIFVRKKGKDIPVGEFKTLPKAEKELFKTIREEIRASGFIKKSGRKIKIDIGGTEFLRSKRDQFRIVEPRQRRIKRGTKESFQIQKAKKKKGFFK